MWLIKLKVNLDITLFLPFFPFSYVQEDLSDLDLETLAPYIPMDGEDFQLNPIIPESEPLEATQAGSMGSMSNPSIHQSCNNVASLFQPLTSPPQRSNCYQPQPEASWAAGERRGSNPGSVETRQRSCMMRPTQSPHFRGPASTPLSSMQWPPDPIITYQHQQLPPKSCLMDSVSGEERPSCQQSISHPMYKQRWVKVDAFFIKGFEWKRCISGLVLWHIWLILTTVVCVGPLTILCKLTKIWIQQEWPWITASSAPSTRWLWWVSHITSDAPIGFEASFLYLFPLTNDINLIQSSFIFFIFFF